MSFFQVPFDTAPPVRPDTLFVIGTVEISNAMLMGVLLTLIFTIFSLYIKKNLKFKPNRFQLLIERLVESFANLVGQIAGGKKEGEKLLPLIGTIFIFFGVSNIITLFPGLSAITYNDVPVFRTPTNDFNMTFSVAFAMVILTHIASMKAFGFFGHIGKFVKIKDIFTGFKQGIRKGIMSVVDFILGLMDIISEFAKVFSLSLRLFGNMYAGEVLAAVLLGSFAIAVPTVWLAMNFFVGILQAMVFGALTAAYYGMAVRSQESENF